MVPTIPKDFPKPVGFVTRKHEGSTLVADGGRIVSVAGVLHDQVPAGYVYSERQIQEYLHELEQRVRARVLDTVTSVCQSIAQDGEGSPGEIWAERCERELTEKICQLDLFKTKTVIGAALQAGLTPDAPDAGTTTTTLGLNP